MSWNWALRDRFMAAAKILNYPVECNWSYYKMQIPGEVYCYLWHPLNKMQYLDHEGSAEEALRHIQSNQDDFHIEIDRCPSAGDSITWLMIELQKDPSVDDIVQCIHDAHDPTALAKRQVFATLYFND